MKVVNTFPGIYHFQAKDQYELTSTFIRLQEFYESPYKEIRGQYFELDTFFDIYAKKMGNMTYFTDWNGFNVPGHIIDDFCCLFLSYDNFRQKEKRFYRLSCDNTTKSYYIIGTWRKGDIDHELCH